MNKLKNYELEIGKKYEFFNEKDNKIGEYIVNENNQLLYCSATKELKLSMVKYNDIVNGYFIEIER